MEENIRTLKLLTALIVIMHTHYLEMEVCDMQQIYLKSILKGWQPLKNYRLYQTNKKRFPVGVLILILQFFLGCHPSGMDLKFIDYLVTHFHD